jgi:hypothetical protein
MSPLGTALPLLSFGMGMPLLLPSFPTVFLALRIYQPWATGLGVSALSLRFELVHSTSETRAPTSVYVALAQGCRSWLGPGREELPVVLHQVSEGAVRRAILREC